MNDYLRRRDERLNFDQLKLEIIFGMVISGMLLTIGGWHYFMVVGANDTLWAAVAALGALGFAAAIVFPTVWRWPERALSGVMSPLGRGLFSALLTLIYGLLFTPVGWFLRRSRGLDPIYAWEGQVPAGLEGWRKKEVLFETNTGRTGHPNLAKRLFRVLQFFAGRGHFVILPVLIILIALGMVLFFVQSSALAPFIYTLF